MKTIKQFPQSILISIFRPVLFILLLLLCGLLSAQVDKSYFDVYYSTSQSWVGGEYGSGGGENYTFHVRFNKEVNIRLDTVWFGDKPSYIFSNKYAGYASELKVQKGDSIYCTSSIYYPSEKDMMFTIVSDKTTSLKNPCPELKGDGLIQFRVNGVKYYYPVKNMIKLAPIAYP